MFRFRHAEELLTDGWSPVRTAAVSGFSDEAHLTREFKRLTGLTPALFHVNGFTGVAESGQWARRSSMTSVTSSIKPMGHPQ
ncbi:hypothetical protein GCM10010411_82450 [Actinomadura fulvescens]|uniref:HTH araC/xylS-type domain-containing protein n=1 Tax=Actinomadura fulvescens TaxID=46160 RepID=A0ABN3QQ37_9ACTN